MLHPTLHRPLEWAADLRGANSIFWRLFTALIAVIVLSSALASAALWYAQQERIALGGLDLHAGGRKAVQLALTVNAWGGRDALVQWLQSPSNSRPTVYIVDESGSEISGRAAPEPALRAIASKMSARAEAAMLEEQALSAIVHVEIDSRPYTAFASYAGNPPDFRRLNPFHRDVPLAAILAAAFILTALVSAVLAYYYTRPLRKLDAAMRDFADGQLDTRVVSTIGRADAEVTALAQMFDRMAEQISSLIHRQRKLFHSVSHELRSPLARIDVALELARIDPGRVPASLERIDREVREIDHLVERLLTYARLEEGTKLELAPADICSIAERAAEDAAFEAQKKNVRVAVTRPAEGAIELPVNEPAIRSAIENILRNGLRHTPAGSELAIRVESAPDAVRIACTDEGPGMPEEELGHIFDPFMRGSREQTGTGFGLGLSIARSAVLAHGGRISAKNRTPHGLEVVIELPRTKVTQ